MLKLRLYQTAEDEILKSDPANDGLDEAMELLAIVEDKGIDIERIDTGQLSDKDIQETYMEAVPVETSIRILEYDIARDELPPPASFTITHVYGKLKNESNVTLLSSDVSVWVEYEIELEGFEGRKFQAPGGIGLEPAAFKPDEVRNFSVLVRNDIREICNVSVNVLPEQTVTVEKQRTVTKYRQEERQRTVTKQRPETRYKKVTLLDYLLHY